MRNESAAPHSMSLSIIRRLEADFLKSRESREPADNNDALFRDHLEELLRSGPDEELYDAIWSFKEGSISRLELLRRPAYKEAALRELAATSESLPPEVLAQVQERLETYRETHPEAFAQED